MKRLNLFIPLFFIAFIFFFVSKNEVFAQTCNPGPTCCNAPLVFRCSTGCIDIGGGVCRTAGGAACSGSNVCTAGTFQAACGYNFGVCMHNTNTCNYVSGACGSPIGGGPSTPAPSSPGSTPPPATGSCDGCTDAGSCSGKGGSFSGSSASNHPECAAQGGYCSGTTTCGGGTPGGGGSTPSSSVARYFVTSYASAYPTSAIGKVAVGAPFASVAYPINESYVAYVTFTVLTGNAVPVNSTSTGYVYYNATAPHFWVSASLKATAPGTVTVRSDVYVNGAGYVIKWDSNTHSILATAVASPAPTLTLTASPTTVPLNGSTTLTWTSTNTTTCTASGDWTGTKAVNGTQVEAGISSNDTYTLTCSGTGGSIVKTVNVSVNVPPAPLLSLTASPTSVPNNGSTTLTWSSTNTTGCTASNGWTGAKVVSGSQAQTGITTSKSYVLTCTGPGGSISKTVNVSVTVPPAPLLSLTASPTSVPNNGSTTLTWSSTNTTGCTASNGWTGAKAVSGSQAQAGITAAKTFVLTCTGPGGSISKTVNVSLIGSPALPNVNLTASPTAVPNNGSTTLTWTTSNSTTCTASNGWTGTKAVNGSQVITAITAAKTFVLTCNGPGGSSNDSASVSVNPGALPNVNLTASPTSVPNNGSTTLSWTTSNTTSCTASNGWTGAKAVNGSQVITAITSAKTFVLTCTGPGGSSNDSAAVSVNPGALPNVNLIATPNTAPYAGSTTLSWTTTNSTTCTASNGWTGIKAINGSQNVTNLLSNKTFLLTCTGPGGTGNDSAAVSVAAPILPTVTLTATPTNIVGPSNVRLTWSSTSATTCTASGGWSGVRGTSGGQTMVGVAADTTYRLTCTNAGGTAVDTATVNYTPPSCGLARPRDPAPPVCAPNPPAVNGSITWTWPAVPGADLYDFHLVNATTGTTIAGTSTGMVNGQSNFNCRPNQATPDLCSKTTTLPPGLYRSVITSGNSTASCLPSTAVTYPPVGQPGKEVLLCPAVPWWQSGTGSVFSQGNIKSTIPLTCSAPACVNQIIKNGNSSAPGIAISGSSGTIDSGTGVVSSTNWAAKSALTGRTPDYDSFVSLIPTSITPSDPGATCGGGTFNSSGATTGDGYYWYRHNGSVNITSDLTLDPGRKVILFVDGNLTISGKITYNPANSFFMPIVKGNITVSPTVTTATGTPTLTGIFYCGGQFSSGAGTGPLNILGSVVAVGGVSLERDLGDANHTESSENFSISPDLILNYPGALSFKRPVWKEIAP